MRCAYVTTTFGKSSCSFSYKDPRTMPKPSKTPRPAATYRGARRNAFKRGERPGPHKWQTRPHYATQYVPPVRANEKLR